MKSKKILVYSNKSDLIALTEKIDSKKIDKNDILKIKKIFKYLIESDHLIIDDSFSGELLALIFKIVNYDKTFDIWLNEFRHYPVYQKNLHNLTMKLSNNIFTRSKQIRFYINQLYKKPVFVIYPWIKEVNYKKRKPKYNIFIDTIQKIDIPEKWNRVYDITKADISILEFEKNLLKVSLPKIIFHSISLRIPTIILYDNTKLVNKLFKSIHNLYPIQKIDFDELEFLMFKNYSFKIPKRYRFNYNLANFKKRVLK